MASAGLIAALNKTYLGNDDHPFSDIILLDAESSDLVKALFFSLVNGNIGQRCSMPVRNSSPYLAIAKIVVHSPWNELFSFDECEGSIGIHRAVTEADLVQFERIMSRFDIAIE